MFMKITKFKLIKGTYLAIEGHDGNKDFSASWPKLEAPPKLVKAFQQLNSHVCDLCEQYADDGQPDYDMVVFRGASIKEGEESESVVLTGLRTLTNGRTITLNTPSVMLDSDLSEYPHIAALISGLDRIDTEILAFMENNKPESETQGNLFKQHVILEAQEPVTAASIIFAKENAASAKNAQDNEETINEGVTGPERALSAKIDKEKAHAEKQAELDAKEPVKSRLVELTEKAKVTELTPEEQGELQKLNADAKKAKKK